MTEGIRVEGVREVTRALNKAGGRELTKQMGQANKTIGQMVIGKLHPLPKTVGLGAGARVRPSANARLVQLLAGGKHRDAGSLSAVKVQQWGKRYEKRTTERPYIAKTAIGLMPNIERTYFDALHHALRELDGLERG